MAERITKLQLFNALKYATTTGRACGALREGDWLGTATAWTMDYVCVYDVDGRMVRALSNPSPIRGLFDYARAVGDAWQMAERRATVTA